MNKNRNGTYLCRLFEPSTDLIKQLYAFAGCVEHHIENNYHIIILDDFFHHKPVPVSTILDIGKLLYHLYNPPPFSPLKRGIKTLEIIDKNKLNFRLTSIIYGNELKFDLTSHFHIKNNVLDINQGILDKAIEKKKFQEIGEKKLTIKYSLEERTIDQTFIIKNDRSLSEKDRILLDYSTSTFMRSPILHKGICMNPLLFIDILKNIKFHDRFYKIIDKITPTGNINIIDLKLDDIHAYSKKLGVEENEFCERIENKYIEMIKKYIYKDDTTILITNSISNRVISYLSDESYTYLVSCKLYESVDTTSLSEANFIHITNSFPKFNIPLNMLDPITFLEEKQDSNIVITPLKMLEPISLPKFVKAPKEEKETKQIEPETIMLDMLDNMDIPIENEKDKQALTIPPVPDSEILDICLALKCTNVFIGRNDSSLGEYMLDICKNEKTYLFNYDMDKLVVEDCKNTEKEVCCCF